MGNFTVSPHEMAPYPGIIFETSGNYGSTTFDSFGSAMLSIVICDACMKEKADRGGQVPFDEVVQGIRPQEVGSERKRRRVKRTSVPPSARTRLGPKGLRGRTSALRHPGE